MSLLENDKELVGSFHFVKVQFEGKPYLSNIYCEEVPEILCTEDLIAKRSLMHTSSLFSERMHWFSRSGTRPFSVEIFLYHQFFLNAVVLKELMKL